MLHRARWLLLALLLPACSLNKTDESQKDRTMALLNERKYDQSVSELEATLRDNPRDRSTALLLAMAHIGKANAEMLQLFTAVLGHQGEPPPALLAKVRCDDEPWDSLRDKSVACIATRILDQVPESLNPDVARAQELLRQYYADPKGTDADVNFFAAYVELYRMLNRARYLMSPPLTAEVNGLHLDAKSFDDVTTPEFDRADKIFAMGVRELKSIGDEFMQTFKRLKYSYGKLTKYTASIDGKPILEYKGHVLIFDEDMTVGRIAQFGITVLNAEKGRTDARLNGNFSGLLSRVAPQIVELAREMQYVSGPSGVWDQLTTSLDFEDMIKNFLRGLGDSGGRAPNADLSDWMIGELDTATDELWKNPPGLFGDLANALHDSWDAESMKALVAYHKATAPQWQELADILRLWGHVRDNHADGFEGRLMERTLIQHREQDRNYLKFPAEVSPQSVDGWFRAILAEGANYERDYELGKYSSDGQPPNAERRALVHEAWTRSRAWVETNLLLQP